MVENRSPAAGTPAFDKGRRSTETKTGKRNILSYLAINRIHVAVRLFSNRSQMTSKCDKNKKVAHEPLGECVTDVLTTF